MTIIEFLKDYLPNYLGINKAYGAIAEWIFLEEKKGNPIFANENFRSLRDRAALGIPCSQIEDQTKLNNMLDFFEWALCVHRYAHHNEDYQNRISELIQKESVQKMAEIVPSPDEWWIG